MPDTHSGGDMLTEDPYLCPPCFHGDCHGCTDLFTLPPFGLLACHHNHNTEEAA